jgi:hypothetical protein
MAARIVSRSKWRGLKVRPAVHIQLAPCRAWIERAKSAPVDPAMMLP